MTPTATAADRTGKKVHAAFPGKDVPAWKKAPPWVENRPFNHWPRNSRKNRKGGGTSAAKDHQEERGGAGLLKWSEEVNYSPERTVLDPVIEGR